MENPFANHPRDVYMHIMRPNLDFASPENCACFNLRRISRVITQFYDAEVRRHGLRPTQTPILRALRSREGWGMAELSEFLGLERTTLLRNLRPLERDGLVCTRGGGRGGHVELEITSKGRRILEKIQPSWRSAQEKVIAVLGRERWSEIIRDLQTVAAELNVE